MTNNRSGRPVFVAVPSIPGYSTSPAARQALQRELIRDLLSTGAGSRAIPVRRNGVYGVRLLSA